MDETARLNLLRRYDILDTPREPAFDYVVEIAARVLSMPLSLVTFVDENRVWFKASHGLTDSEIVKLPGFCASAIEQNKPWLVEDASTDPRCADHPWVTGNMRVRCYAAIPLEAPKGHCLGTLCAMDTRPRRLKQKELTTLKEMAALIVNKLASRLASEMSAFRRRSSGLARLKEA